MILHTVVPPQAVVGDAEAPQARDVRVVPLANGFLELQPGTDGYNIRRLVSTDLRAYLNPLYGPGRPYRISNEFSESAGRFSKGSRV